MSSRRITIAVDLDDVLCRYADAFVQLSNSLWNTALTPRDYSEDWRSLWAVGEDEDVAARVSKLQNDGFYAELAPIAGAFESVCELRVNFKLIAITSRSLEFYSVTYDWLQRYFANCFEDLIFIPRASKKSLSRSLKGGYCSKNGVDVLVDDQYEQCESMVHMGLSAVWFRQFRDWKLPQGSPQRLAVAGDWREVPAAIFGLRL
ncbi:5' nucleotidase, NT5C type [Nocardia cerradoensis]|uniref:5' nucleotidase, NT5C type n=1 Tax=Nocardia cerradoensis TaxID=85688 RepID=UPI000B8B35E1|nr:hypothetical protein [Nocardia cerradoensis]